MSLVVLEAAWYRTVRYRCPWCRQRRGGGRAQSVSATHLVQAGPAPARSRSTRCRIMLRASARRLRIQNRECHHLCLRSSCSCVGQAARTSRNGVPRGEGGHVCSAELRRRDRRPSEGTRDMGRDGGGGSNRPGARTSECPARQLTRYGRQLPQVVSTVEQSPSVSRRSHVPAKHARELVRQSVRIESILDAARARQSGYHRPRTRASVHPRTPSAALMRILRD